MKKYSIIIILLLAILLTPSLSNIEAFTKNPYIKEAKICNILKYQILSYMQMSKKVPTTTLGTYYELRANNLLMLYSMMQCDPVSLSENILKIK